MKEYLVESALLTHGLKGISNETLLSVWKQTDKKIVWIEHGKICIGNIQRFCEFRSNAFAYGRINYFNFDKCVKEGKSGCLTASGVIKVCEMLGIPLVISCGIGGMMAGDGNELCRDIEAMANSSVSLVATAPKDMFDLDATFAYIKQKNIKVVGVEKEYCDGYMFNRTHVMLDCVWAGETIQEKTLYLQGIPNSKRITNFSLLEEAYRYGKKQEQAGELFHPAVNGKIDELTEGLSSEIQLQALWKNVLWVECL